MGTVFANPATYVSKKPDVSVPCLPLTNPDNGMINCSLGDDGVHSYKDTCNFTCNTGYELTGNDTRTCQSDGSWSGSDVMCSNNTATMSFDIIIGAVLGSLFLLLILIILMCGIMLVKNRKKQRLHNIAIYGKGIQLIIKIYMYTYVRCLVILQYLDKQQQHCHSSLDNDNKVRGVVICML